MSTSSNISARRIAVPGPEHPITIEPTGKRVEVTYNGRVVASSGRALTLKEANYPAVHYLPLADVDQSLLESSEHSTYCPYKGDASYYSVKDADATGVNAIWFYDTPFEAVAEIKGHVAFYADRFTVKELS